VFLKITTIFLKKMCFKNNFSIFFPLVFKNVLLDISQTEADVDELLLQDLHLFFDHLAFCVDWRQTLIASHSNLKLTKRVLNLRHIFNNG